MTERLPLYPSNPKAVTALSGVDQHITSLEPKLKTLVEIRVSQVNGCAYCIDLHTAQARAFGDTQQRLDCLPAWREAGVLYSASEQAALNWAESVTHLSDTHAPDADYTPLLAHFSQVQIADLTLTISQMNSWNRLAVALRKALPVRAQ